MILIFLLSTINFCCQDEISNEIVKSGTVDQDKSISAVNTTSTTISADNPDQRLLLQNQINTQASLKKTLYLPAGRYLISDEIILPSNTAIEGVGDNTEIILTSGSKAGRNVFRIPTRMTNISFRNIKINANQAGNTGADLVALFITDNVTNLYFKNVNFAGGRDRGAVQIKGLNNYQVKTVKFEHCRFSEAGRTSLELRGTRDVSVINCLFENWGTQNPNSPAIQLQSQDNYNTQIVTNIFNNRYARQFAIECAAAYVYDAKISDNKLNDPNNLGGNGISGYYKRTLISKNIFTGGNGNQRSGLEIFGQNNTLSYNTIPAGSIALAPGLGEDGSDILVNNNTIKTRGSNIGGIQMGNGSYNLKNIKIIDNTVDTRLSTGNSSGIVVGTYGIPRVVTNITVETNTIYSSSHCIRLQSLPGSKDIFLLRNNCKEGYDWLSVITNTFQNVRAIGNIKGMSNKTISYSVSMPPIIEQ